jgi:hypothetical protein
MMIRKFSLQLAAAVATLAMTAACFAQDYEVGQIWSAKGRSKDPDPHLLILKVERGSPVGDVVFIAVGGIKICLPNGKCGDIFSPLAMSKQALDKSVTKHDGKTDKLPDFEQGYARWKEGVAKGVPVTVTVPLAEALDQIEAGSKIQVK